jgi:hypothetical protein
LSDSSEITRFSALAEEALSAIYDARGTDVRAALEDARYNFERALAIARMRGYDGQAAQLEKQLARVEQLFAARFKKKRPTAP